MYCRHSSPQIKMSGCAVITALGRASAEPEVIKIATGILFRRWFAFSFVSILTLPKLINIITQSDPCQDNSSFCFSFICSSPKIILLNFFYMPFFKLAIFIVTFNNPCILGCILWANSSYFITTPITFLPHFTHLPPLKLVFSWLL